MSDITVIMPVHELNGNNDKLIVKAIESVPDGYAVKISCKNGIGNDLAKLTDGMDNVEVVEQPDSVGHDFCSLVNAAVDKVSTGWFSILEFDDTYTPIWFRNVERYVAHDPSYSVFLPLEELTDFNTKEFIGYGNEAPWATSFSNEIGVIDEDCLEQYFDFYLTGSVFNVKDWKDLGGLKPSIKLTFWYEFLLRATKNNKGVMVIPKLGYHHSIGRSDSIIEIYKKTISEEDSNKWFDLAKNESLYKKDRNKTID